MNSTPVFSEDIVPISDLKVNPGKIITQLDRTHRPVLLTSRGRGVAVVQSLKDYENKAKERSFLKSVIQGLMDVEEGRTVTIAEAKNRLGLI